MKIFALSIMMAAGLVASTAWADKATDDAKKRFEQGNTHYNLGEYKEALAEYKEAYRIKKLPGFLFNIAQCHRKLGDYQQAINLYNAYLNQVPNAPNRADVESLIAESREKQAGAQKAEEDQRRIHEAEAREKAEAERRKAEEERRRAEEARARTLSVRPAVDESQYDQHPTRTWAYVGMGAGVLIAGTGAFFAIRASSAQSAFDDAGCGDPASQLGSVEIDECQDNKKTGEQSALLANVLFGAGAVVAGGAVVLWVLDPGNVPRPQQARVLVSPTGVAVRWQF
jgi:tetratricopeptide (TPR) repeat protein